jgi:hypothetical protein
VADYHAAYIHCNEVVDPNIGISPAGQWTMVLTDLPWSRGRTLFDDPTEEFHRIYEKGTSQEVVGAAGYCLMRIDFFTLLESRGVNHRHVNDFEVTAAQVWFTRFGDLMESFTSKGKRRAVPAVPEWRH